MLGDSTLDAKYAVVEPPLATVELQGVVQTGPVQFPKLMVAEVAEAEIAALVPLTVPPPLQVAVAVSVPVQSLDTVQVVPEHEVNIPAVVLPKAALTPETVPVPVDVAVTVMLRVD